MIVFNGNIYSHPKPLSPIKTQLSPTRTMTQAEEMRQQRNNEAKQLIGSRVGTAKAIFTQNTASGQMLTSKTAAPQKPVRNSIAQRINSLNNQSATADGNTKIDDEDLEDQPQKTISPIAEVEPTNITVSPTKEQTPANKENILSNSEMITDTNGKKTMHEVQMVKQTNRISSYIMRYIYMVFTKFLQLQTEQYEDDGGDQYSTIKRSPYTKTNSNNSQVTTPVETEPPQQYYSKVIDEHSNKKVNVAEQRGKYNFSFRDLFFFFWLTI